MSLHPRDPAATIKAPKDMGQRIMTERNKSTGNESTPPGRTARHVIFRGHVQGVGFRYTAREIAQQYDVAGFVRNLPDGTVEMLLQGPAQDIDRCIQEVQGFFEGYVRDTQIEETPYNPRYTDFRIAF